eukprot:jgi/Mesvir1/20554/Mv06231-RA.1
MATTADDALDDANCEAGIAECHVASANGNDPKFLKGATCECSGKCGRKAHAACTFLLSPNPTGTNSSGQTVWKCVQCTVPDAQLPGDAPDDAMAAFANRFRLRPNDPTSRQLEVDFGAGSSPGITHPVTAATSGVTQETPQSHLPEISGLANGDVQPSGEVLQTTLSNATAEGVPITVGVPVETPSVSQSEGTSPVEFAPGGSLYQCHNALHNLTATAALAHAVSSITPGQPTPAITAMPATETESQRTKVIEPTKGVSRAAKGRVAVVSVDDDEDWIGHGADMMITDTDDETMLAHQEAQRLATRQSVQRASDNKLQQCMSKTQVDARKFRHGYHRYAGGFGHRGWSNIPQLQLTLMATNRLALSLSQAVTHLRTGCAVDSKRAPWLFDVVGEGTANPHGELPIDINYMKLADWLADRKKVPKDWRKKLASVQARHASLAASLGSNISGDLQQVVSSGSLDYLGCKQILHRLQQEPPGALPPASGGGGGGGLLRHFTGSSQVDEWKAVVRAYEKESLQLGEAALILLQNVNYEIPFLRKSIAKSQQQLSDLDRREAECQRSAAQSLQRYRAACEQLGIEGKDAAAELHQLSQRVQSQVYDVAVEAARCDAVGEAMRLYAATVVFAHAAPDGTGADASLVSLLPALHDIRTRASAMVDPAELPGGNSGHSGSQQAVGCILLGADHPSATDASLSLSAAPPGINWDIDMGESASSNAAPPTIQWDIGDVGSSEGGGGDTGAPPAINWDVGDVQGGESGGAPAGINWDVGDAAGVEPGGGINWDVGPVEVEGGGIDWNIEGGGLELEVVGLGAAEGGVTMAGSEVGSVGQGVGISLGQGGGGAGATGEGLVANRVHVLASAETRKQLLNDLSELRAFLATRRAEAVAQERSPMPLWGGGDDTPVATLSPADLAALEAAVRRPMETLAGRAGRELILISSSARHRERLVGSLRQKLLQSEGLGATVRDLEARRVEVRKSLMESRPKLEKLLQSSRELKAEVEKVLSAQFQGRPVNIIGEINNVLG